MKADNVMCHGAHQHCNVVTDVQSQRPVAMHDEVESESEVRKILWVVAETLSKVREAAKPKEAIFVHSLHLMLIGGTAREKVHYRLSPWVCAKHTHRDQVKSFTDTHHL